MSPRLALILLLKPLGDHMAVNTGIYSALSGVKVKELELEMVAHNMANVNTTGFKEEQFSFESVMSKYGEQGESPSTPYVKVTDQRINFANGALITTNNPMDVGLEGKGFMEVQNEAGTFYTRSGAMTLNKEGELVVTGGAKVMGTNGTIKVEAGSKLEISPSGLVTQNGSELGSLKLVSFEDESKIKSVGSNLYKAETDATPKAAEELSVYQGKLEQSNTNVMLGLVKLIDISRQYQSYQKIINTQSKLEQDAASSIGRVN